MRKFFLILSAAASLASLASAADAATFTWSYTDGGLNNGSGELDATETAPNSGVFTIDSITGMANGFSINFGPFTGFAGTGNTIYWGPDEPQVFDPLDTFYFTDVLGFAFQVITDEYFAIYENTAVVNPPDEPGPYACGGPLVPYCLLGPGPEGDGLDDQPIALTNFQVDLVPSEVPLPAALPLLASSMAGLGFLARRRKRKAAV
ncbi:MAG: VPLPA-CTERM sorting domain-containing protein [Aestuariivirga sp.]